MGRKSKSGERKQEILSHFYEVIKEEGFEGASIAKIAKRMEVNPSLLIHYFSTKDAMVSELIDYVSSTYFADLFPDFSIEKNPVQRWEYVLDTVSRIQWGTIMDTTVFYSCFTLSLRNNEVRDKFVPLYQHMLDILTVEIKLAMGAEIIRTKNPEETAQMIVTLIEGTNFLQQVNPNPDTPEQVSNRLKRMIDALCN